MQLKIIYKNIKKNNIFIHKMEQNNETNTLLFQILEEMKKTNQKILEQNNLLATNEKHLQEVCFISREICYILHDLYNKIPVDYCCNALRVNNIN